MVRRRFSPILITLFFLIYPNNVYISCNLKYMFLFLLCMRKVHNGMMEMGIGTVIIEVEKEV